MLRSLLVLSLLSLSSALVAGPVVAVAPSVSRVTSSPSMIALTKPQRTNQRRRAYNKMYKSEMKTAIKRVFEAVEQGDYQYASMRLNKAQSIIDKNVKRNIMHKNTAARRKSLLTMKVKALEGAAAAPAPAAESPAEEA